MMLFTMMMMSEMTTGYFQDNTIMLVRRDVSILMKQRQQTMMEMIDVMDNKYEGGGGKIDVITTKNEYPIKRFVLDMLCGNGETTMQLYEMYKDSIVFGCTNEERGVFTTNILTKRYPDCMFYTYDELKRWGPDRFDIIQIHHRNLIENEYRNEICDYIDEHIQTNGYIVYNYEGTEEEVENIEFFKRGYRSWIHSKQIYFSR